VNVSTLIRASLAALFVALAAPTALAAGGKADSKKSDVERFIVADNVITPVVRDGRLQNYLFVTVRVDLPDKADVWRLRTRSAFLRDALLRAGHRAQLGDPQNDRALNEAAALAAFRAAAVVSLGADGVKSVSIAQVQSLK
jgi:hypothetical protein